MKKCYVVRLTQEKRCVTEGLEAALERKKHSRERTARLVSLAYSDAPAGRSCWTLQLLCMPSN